MPLSTGVVLLKQRIREALTRARDAGRQKNENLDFVITSLAKDLSGSIQEYMESARVVTTHTITPGQVAPFVGPLPAAGSGVLSSVGSGQGSDGTLRFITNEVLKLQIEEAYKDARKSGSQDNAVSSIVTANLAISIANAVNTFALTGIVETDIRVLPGVIVSGYTTPPPAIAAVPSFTSTGDGKGIGILS